MIKQYTIITGTAYTVSLDVNDHLKAGWELYGNLCIEHDDGISPTVAQAMVFKEKV